MADNIRGPVIGEPSRPDGDEERIVTPLSRKRAGLDPKKGIGVAAIFAMAAGMLYFTFEHHTRSDQQAPPSPAGEQINFQAPVNQPPPLPIHLRPEPANPAVVAAQHVQSQTGNEQQTLASKLLAASYEAPLSAFSGGGGGAGDVPVSVEIF